MAYSFFNRAVTCLYAFFVPLLFSAQEVEITDIGGLTQTKALLSARFAEESVSNGFQYKYGVLPVPDEFSRNILASSSDPICFEHSEGTSWEWREAMGWAESRVGLSAGESSELSATFTLAQSSTLSFEWKVDTEEGRASLEFLLDGNTLSSGYSISGLVEEFIPVKLLLTPGEHTITWRYVKTGDVEFGGDIGMLRNVCVRNTTPGRWLDSPAMASSFTLAGLWPGQDYLVRGYSVVQKTGLIKPGNIPIVINDTIYSAVQSFSTASVEIDSVWNDSPTQTTALLHAGVSAGDAAVKGSFLVGERLKSESEFANVLVSSPATSPALVSVSNPPQYLSIKDQSIHLTNVTGSQHGTSEELNVSFVLAAPTAITWDWKLEGYYSYLTTTVDGETFSNYKGKSGTTLSGRDTCLLEAGEHTISWRFSVYDNFSSVSLSNLEIPGLLSNVRTFEAQPAGEDFSLRLEDLKPGRDYACSFSLLPAFESALEPCWERLESGWIGFRAAPITVETLPLSNLLQTTAVVRGYVNGGDAKLVAQGLQFRSATSNVWRSYSSNDTSDTLQTSLSRLRPDTEYQYRVYAQAAGCDTVFSEVADFRTPPVQALKPVLTGRTQHTADIEAEIQAEGLQLYACGLQFRPKGAAWEDLGGNVIGGLLSKHLEDLEMDASYQIRAYVQTQGTDTIYSPILDFRTKGIDTYADSVSVTGCFSAKAYGRVSPGNGAILSKSVRIYHDNKLYKEVPVATQDTAFSLDISGLQPGTEYAFRVKAVGANGKSYESAVQVSDFSEAFLGEGSDPVSFLNEGRWTSYDDAVAIYTHGLSAQRMSAWITCPAPTVLRFTAMVGGYSYVNYKKAYSEIRFYVDDKLEKYFYPETDGKTKLTSYTYRLPEGVHHLVWEGSTIFNEYYGNPISCRLSDFFVFGTKDGGSCAFKTKPLFQEWNGYANEGYTTLELFDAIDDDYDMTQITQAGFVLGGRMYPAEMKGNRFSVKIAGLVPGKQYEYQSYCITNNGIKYLNVSRSSYTMRPKVTSNSVAEVRQTSALACWETVYGDATYVCSGIEYFCNGEFAGIMADSTSGNVEMRLCNLKPNTQYNYRWFIETKEGGRLYIPATTSNLPYFRTSQIEVKTLDPGQISNRSARLNGVVACDTYSDALLGFEWKSMTGWESDPAFTECISISGDTLSLGLVNGLLEPDTDYQYRVAVKYQGTVYTGAWKTFRTEQEYVWYPAEVQTVYRTDRQRNALVLCGYYVAGSEEVLSQGYEYWLDDTPKRTANGITRIQTDGSMMYELDMDSLAEGTYQIRAFVETTTEVYYGKTLSFRNTVATGIDTLPLAEQVVCIGQERSVLLWHAEGRLYRMYGVNGNLLKQGQIQASVENIEMPAGFYVLTLDSGETFKVRVQ